MAGTLAEIFGPERFYIEVQDHGIREQVETDRNFCRLRNRWDYRWSRPTTFTT